MCEPAGGCTTVDEADPAGAAVAHEAPRTRVAVHRRPEERPWPASTNSNPWTDACPQSRLERVHPAVPPAQAGRPAGAAARLVRGQDRPEPRPPGRRPGRLCAPGRVLVAAAGRRLPRGRGHPGRLDRPRRRPPADLPHPPRQRPGRPGPRQPADRDQLRVVGPSTTPTTPTPTTRSSTPRSASPRWSFTAAQARDNGARPGDRPFPGPDLPPAAARGRLSSRELAVSPRRRPAPLVEALLLRSCRRLRGPAAVDAAPGAHVAGSQACPASTWPHRSRPTTRACPPDRRDQPLRRASGARLPQRPAAPADRLLLRRPQLPDRAPPVPDHAAPNLRRAQPLVRAFCREHDLPYVEATLFGSYAEALRHLHAVGAPLRPPVPES